MVVTSNRHFPDKKRLNPSENPTYLALFRPASHSHALRLIKQPLGDNNKGAGGSLIEFDLKGDITEPTTTTWKLFKRTIGDPNILIEATRSDKSLEIFEAFLEFKRARTCRDDKLHQGYFAAFITNIDSFNRGNLPVSSPSAKHLPLQRI